MSADALLAAVAAAGSCSLHRQPFLQDHLSRRSRLPLPRLECRRPSLSSPSIGIASLGAGSGSLAAGCTTARSAARLPEEEERPASVGLEPVVDEEQFDRIIAEAHRLEEPVIVLWAASWCRKCIYLKPKLEKLAAAYYPRIRFCSVDVNTVPHRLVKRAGVTKMPTIQLWRDSKIQGEVVGGYKAWMAVDDVQKMIENED